MSDGPTPDTRGAHARYSLYVCRPVVHTLLVPDTLIFLQEGDHQLLIAQLEVLPVFLVFVLARLPNPTAVTGLQATPAKHGSLPTQHVSVSEYESREGMAQIGQHPWQQVPERVDPLLYRLLRPRPRPRPGIFFVVTL